MARQLHSVLWVIHRFVSVLRVVSEVFLFEWLRGDVLGALMKDASFFLRPNVMLEPLVGGWFPGAHAIV